MEAQLDLYGDNVFDRLLTADILERLCEIIDFHQSDTAFSDIKLVFSSTYLGFKTAQKERIRNLNALASRFEVNLYTDRTDDRLRGVHVRESVDYREEMPLVFHESDINMNFTIRNIRTGLPLRIWDILGAGGFLLTNYQIEQSPAQKFTALKKAMRHVNILLKILILQKMLFPLKGIYAAPKK